MKCPSCGTEDLSGLYCSNCGNRIPLNKEDNYTKADNETNELNCNNVTVPIKKSKTKFKKSEILSLVVLFIIIGITIFSISINYYLALSEKEENYKKCIQLVRENKWKDTSLAMYVIQKENYRDSKIIYSYICSHESIEKNDYNMARYYLNDIPDNYKGELHDEIIAYKKELENKKYKIALDLIRSLKFQDAISFCVGDDDLKPFCNLANALIETEKGNYSMARSYAKDLNAYNGYAKDEVKSYVQTIMNETTPEKLKMRKKSEGVSIGMTQDEVLESSWGKPTHKNKTTTSYGVHEQWVYGKYYPKYLYFDNGILTTIQN